MLLAFVMAAPMLAGTVRADSTVTFTTTSDFDNGTKLDPGAKWFVNNGIDQPSDWINYPHAWYANGRTYVVWQGDADYKIYITYYDHTTTTWATPVAIVPVNPANPDGHGSPALGITNDGYLHVFCCAHISPILYFRSASPYSITSWTNKTAAFNVPSGTYEHIEILPSGAMWVMYRINSAGANGDWVYNTTSDSGTTWTNGRTLTQFGASPSPYIGNTELKANKIYMSWTRYSAGLIFNVYSAYWDTATDHMFCGATDLGLTIDDTEATASCRIVNSGAMETGSCCVITHTDTATGRIYVIYAIQNATVTTTYDLNFTFYNGASWSSPQYIVTTGYFLNMKDFEVFSTTNIHAYLTVLPTDGLFSSPNNEGGDIKEYRWDGTTWSLYQVIGSGLALGKKQGANSDQGLTGVQVVRNYVSSFRLVFNSRVFSTTVADGRLFAWGDGGYILNSAIPSGVPSVETATNNPSIGAGNFSLSNDAGDNFAIASNSSDTWRWFWGQSGTVNASAAGTVHSISGGVLSLGVVPTGSGSTSVRMVETLRGRIGGDFDVRVRAIKINAEVSFNTGNRFMLLNERQASTSPFSGGSFTVDGVGFYREADTRLDAFRATDGTETFVGSSSFPADTICYRVARVVATDTITWYYSTDANCASWIQQATTTFATSASMYVILQVWNDGDVGKNARYDWDNFTLAAGSLASSVSLDSTDYYRLAGSWTSPTQTFVSDIPISVTVGYSGASTSGYINSIAIVDSVGAVIWQDTTHRTSGTSITVPVAGGGTALRHNWAVRVTLAGDGTAAPTVTDVSVSLGVDPGCFATSSLGSTLMTIVPIVLLMAILLAIIGVFLARRGDGLSGLGSLNPTTTSVAVISVIVIVIIFVAVVITGLNLTGSLC